MDTTPRSPLFARLSHLERELEEIKTTQCELLSVLGLIEGRQPEVITLGKGITIERDQDGSFWLQTGQVAGEISAQEYRQLSLWAVHSEQPGQPPAVVEEMGKGDLWRSKYDEEIERLRAQFASEPEHNSTRCQAFGRWAESFAGERR